MAINKKYIKKTTITCPNCNQLIVGTEDDDLNFFSCQHCSFQLVDGVEYGKDVQECPKCGDETLFVEISEDGEYYAECHDCNFTKREFIKKVMARIFLDRLREKSLTEFAERF